MTMRTIKTSTGADITLDGDLLAIMETLYREVTAKRELQRSFEDMVREITHVIEQMNDEERRRYLLESLFLNTVTYENERLNAYMEAYYGQPAAVMRSRQMSYAGPAAGLAQWLEGYAAAGVRHIVLRFAGDHERHLATLADLRAKHGW